jgi:hypothetical protein
MNKNAHPRIAAGLAFMMLVLPGSLLAREKRGAQLVITLKDGHYISGELIAVKPDSLLILAGKDESVDLVAINSIRIVRKSKAGTGALVGVLGGIAGTVLYSSLQKDPDSLWDGFKQSLEIGGAAVGFIGGGLILGIIVGKSAGKDKTIRLAGVSEAGLKIALAYLRKKARIRDFK